MFTICRQKHGVDTKILGVLFTIREQKVKKKVVNTMILWYNSYVEKGVCIHTKRKHKKRSYFHSY